MNGEIRLALPDGDLGYQQSAIQKGFISTTEKNLTSRIDIKDNIYILPKGYTIMSFADKNFDPDLCILVDAPNGDYAAHCGVWCIPDSEYAYVEPVFTLPEYRKLGLGKAAVLEGVNRCGKLGAKQAYVLSSQQFYYNIGFYPCQNDTWWIQKKC